MALLSSHWRARDDARDAARDAPNNHLLLLRFALFNTVVSGLSAAVYLQGWLDGAFGGYTLWLSAIIIGVFCYGLVLCATHVWHTSLALADLAAGRAPAPESRADDYRRIAADAPADSRLLAANLLRLRLNGNIAIVLHTANMLVFLGLIGTVIGFIVALSGVEPQRAGQAENVAPMVATLVQGMSIALYTTLLGALLHLWLIVNYRLLAGGTQRLFHAIVESREHRVDH